MGAAHKFDLTSDVTHLIVGDISTPKYKFVARERNDVIVLKPEWVEAVRQSWMEGGDTDIKALEYEYRLPTFAVAFRNHIQNTSNANGAEFKKDLTKSVTHLIARNTEGQKYKFATQWDIKVVTIRWFNDSLERGMALDEALYHPLLPEQEQGVGAWNRAVSTAKAKGLENESSSNPRPRKLRRIASAKLVDQNEGIWGDIVGTGFENGELKRSRSSQPLIKQTSIVQEARSFASETTFAEAQGQKSSETRSRHDGFLHDCFFFVHGFSSKQANVLRHHLSFNGAQLVGSLSEFSRPEIPKRGNGLYIIVPHKTSQDQIPSTDDLAFECEVVTDMWLERCLDAKALISPESHVANTPVRNFPIEGFREIKVCSTGFSRIDLLHLSKLVDLIGASYNEYLTSSASVLVCNDSATVNQDKLRHTYEWGVPAVTANWLWDSIRSGQKQSFEPYHIRKPTSQSSRDLEMLTGSRPEKRPLESITDSNKVAEPHIETQRTDPSQQRTETTRGDTLRKSKTDASHSPTPASRPQSKNPSPTKNHNQNTSHSIDLSVVGGFLKQAREATSRPASDPSEHDSQNRLRKRKPLLGRAPSHSSVRGLEHYQKDFSRASSIDTLNEDGCGSIIESINNDRIPSLANSGRFEVAEDEQYRFQDENEPQSPPMTQLNYEDPDALAMREKFLRHAGKLTDKKPSTDQSQDIGEIKDLENAGWGTGRRTRNASKVIRDV
ncbi:hypothetical protein EYZ11_011659 [Aspergillus tanneri]|nr:hypothetical protein EYZ11_011659 [Aspergillus tanneri]